MPIYEYCCFECEEFEEMLMPLRDCDKEVQCKTCKKPMIKIPPTGTKFKLTYNPKTDICDWNGNTTRYWDEYKKQKAEGKNVVVPDE